VNELTSEINRLRMEVDTVTQDQSSYVSYEKRSVLFIEINLPMEFIGDLILLREQTSCEKNVSDCCIIFSSS